MDPLPRKKAKTPRRIKRESAMGGSRCHISHTMSHSSARGNPALIKTVINKAACCRGGARERIKNSFWGMLSWRFSLMSQFDRMDNGGGRAFPCKMPRKHLSSNRGVKLWSSRSTILAELSSKTNKTLCDNNAGFCIFCCFSELPDLKLRAERSNTATAERTSELKGVPGRCVKNASRFQARRWKVTSGDEARFN